MRQVFSLWIIALSIYLKMVYYDSRHNLNGWKVDTVVYVPRSTYEKASIRAFNGSVLGESLEVTDLRAKTANGKSILKTGGNG